MELIGGRDMSIIMVGNFNTHLSTICVNLAKLEMGSNQLYFSPLATNIKHFKTETIEVLKDNVR